MGIICLKINPVSIWIGAMEKDKNALLQFKFVTGMLIGPSPQWAVMPLLFHRDAMQSRWAAGIEIQTRPKPRLKNLKVPRDILLTPLNMNELKELCIGVGKVTLKINKVKKPKIKLIPQHLAKFSSFKPLMHTMSWNELRLLRGITISPDWEHSSLNGTS